MTIAEIKSEIAAILKAPEDKVWVRATAMKLTDYCSRCGGSGRYSFNQIDGSRCYGCNGRGHTPPKGKAAHERVLEAAKDAVAEGKLEAYLQSLRDARWLKGAAQEIFAAWRATKAAQSSPSHMIRDHDCTPGQLAARKANAKMAAAYRTFADIEHAKMPASEKAAIAKAAIEAIKAADV